MSEAVISNKSPLIGKSIRDSNFRATYNAAVVAVHRNGERLQGRVGDIKLRNGDTLLLQTGPHFAAAHRDNADFFLVSDVEDSRPIRHERSTLSMVLLGIFVLLLVSEVFSTAISALLIAGAMVITRCVSVVDARHSVDWQTIITIGASFAIGAAMEAAGVVTVVSNLVVQEGTSLPPLAILLMVFVVTSISTEIITNNAAAVLMFPFAVRMADNIDASPIPFVVAVCIAASAAFALPIGYQTHLMVYGPGGYKLTDFLKVGIPLNILVCIVSMIVIPLVWPF